MDYQLLANRMECEWRRLEGVELNDSLNSLDCSSEGLLEYSRMREINSRPAVDAAVRLFIRDSAWPVLSNDERFFLRKRLYYGWLLIDTLLPEGEGSKTVIARSKARESHNILEWLLIDLWRSLGIPLWLEAQAQYYNGCVAGKIL
jgi:hypothetical protein